MIILHYTLTYDTTSCFLRENAYDFSLFLFVSTVFTRTCSAERTSTLKIPKTSCCSGTDSMATSSLTTRVFLFVQTQFDFGGHEHSGHTVQHIQQYEMQTEMCLFYIYKLNLTDGAVALELLLPLLPFDSRTVK